MLEHSFADVLKLLAGKHRTCGIARRRKYDRTRLWRNRFLHLSGSYFKVIVDSSAYDNGSGFSQPDKGIIADPVGRKNDHFVARVQQCNHHIGNRLLGAIGDNDVLGLVRNLIFLLILRGESLAKVLVSTHRRISEKLSFI